MQRLTMQALDSAAGEGCVRGSRRDGDLDEPGGHRAYRAKDEKRLAPVIKASGAKVE